MNRFAPIRLATIASLAFSASLLPAQSPQATQPAPAQAQSTLPATQPTATPEAPPVPLTPSQRPPTRAHITYTNGALSVSANNASLNQILRQIASDTGMKITGGVTEERVFGQYGPDDPAQILAELLDGTSSNMMLVHRDPDAPAELILTPRQGSPTPPNPNAHTFDDRSQAQEAPAAEQPQPASAPPPQSNPGIPPVDPGAAAGSSPANPSQPDSPNGVKTPQQIYEQLQRMRQQQQQPAQPQ
jgi:hypothetical protein